MKAAIYVRVSTSAQAGEDKTSLAEQASELKALAEARGLEVEAPLCAVKGVPEGVFGDPGISGDEVETRPGMVALLARVKQGGIGAVLVRDMNRLARTELASQQIHAVLEAQGVRLVTPSMDYDYGNLQHRLMLGLLGSIEAYAKRWLVMNMARAREKKARRGEFAQAPRPYGFGWDKKQEVKRPEPIAEEIAVVQEVFRLADEEKMSAQSIAAELRRRRIPTRKSGSQWYEGQVSAILRHPCYKGEWQTWPMNLDKTHPDERVLAKDGPAAVIDRARWERVQKLRALHRKRTRRPVKRDFLLQGMVKCGECGSTLTGRIPQAGYRYYACNKGNRAGHREACPAKYVSAQALDDEVWAVMETLAAHPEMAAVYAEETEQNSLPEWRAELERIERAVALLDQQIERAMIAYEKGDYDLDGFARRKAKILSDRDAWRDRAEQYRRLVEGAESKAAAVDRVTEIARGVAEHRGQMDLAEKRRVLKLLAFSTTVWADRRVQIEWAGETLVPGEELLALSHAEP